MIDLSKYKVGDTIGTIYEVYCYPSINGEIVAKKYEECVLETLNIGEDWIEYKVADKKGEIVCSWYGSMPHWKTKIEELFLSINEAHMAYKKAIKSKIDKLTKKIEEYQNNYISVKNLFE